MKYNKRELDIILHMVSLADTGYRLGSNQPFEDSDSNYQEMILFMIMPFIDNPDFDIERAHNSFCLRMERAGWTLGNESFAHKRCPILTSFYDLTQDQVDAYAFLQAVVENALRFIQDMREEDLGYQQILTPDGQVLKCVPIKSFMRNTGKA